MSTLLKIQGMNRNENKNKGKKNKKEKHTRACKNAQKINNKKEEETKKMNKKTKEKKNTNQSDRLTDISYIICQSVRCQNDFNVAKRPRRDEWAFSNNIHKKIIKNKEEKKEKNNIQIENKINNKKSLKVLNNSINSSIFLIKTSLYSENINTSNIITNIIYKQIGRLGEQQQQ